jgi:hypothetical protein
MGLMLVQTYTGGERHGASNYRSVEGQALSATD